MGLVMALGWNRLPQSIELPGEHPEIAHFQSELQY